MFQTVLMFLASPQNPARIEQPPEKRVPRMATRAGKLAPSNRDATHGECPAESPDEPVVTWLAVVGNALGFSVLMTGMWLILRLVETLLP